MTESSCGNICTTKIVKSVTLRPLKRNRLSAYEAQAPIAICSKAFANEIDESAKVDGASHAQIFFKIILPLALPALAVIVLLSFIGTMNEFVLTSVIMGVTGDPNDLTLAVGLQRFIDGQYDQQWGPFAAGALLAAIPVMLLFLFLQKYVVSGLTAGATKG